MAWLGEALRSTYVLSNAAPQLQTVNAGVWRRREATVRMLAARSGAVYVITGTLFTDSEEQAIGPGRVAVPSHFFKVAVTIEGTQRTTLAAMVPNAQSTRGHSLEELTATVEEVERRTGLQFFGEATSPR